MSSISRIAGQMLQANLIRDGNSLAFANTGNSTSTLYIDVVNSRVGINSNVANVTLDVAGNIAGGNLSITGLVSVTGNVTAGNVIVGNILIPAAGNINVGNVNISNLASPFANADAATKLYVDTAVGSVAGNVVGNAIPLGTPTDGSLSGNTVAYDGWTPATFVTDSVDDLNQVALNIAKGTFVGQANLVANVTSGPSPLSVAFTGTYVGTATNFLWNFGDGTTASTQNPTKTYSNVSGGQFSVTFTAWNTSGTWAGNAAAGAKGSVDSTTRTDYITLYTPLPIPSFTTSPTSLDTGSNVTLTNTSLYATSYTINYGDGNSAVNPGNSWSTNSHTYVNSANIDAIYGINLTGTNQTAGNAPPYSVTSANTNVKVYTPQSPAIAANITTTINYLATSGGNVQFRNDTPGSPGNTASFGIQQLYNFQWGDGTANSNINIQTGLAGNPGAANTSHVFALSSVQQNAATTVNYTANLWLYTGYSTSPFKSGNVTISIEPEVRANFIGTSNTQTDATGYTSNAQVGYLYTDYNGRDRSLFNFQNSTSPNVAFTGNVFNWTWGDTTSNTGLITFANITHSYQSAVGSPTTGAKTVTLQANGTPGTLSQSNTQTKTSYITILANPTAPLNLSSFSNVTIANASQGTSPLLAAGANDNTGGNIVANGTSVTRFATTTPIVTAGNVSLANTATTGTLTAYVNNAAAGNVTFSTTGNTVGTAGALVVSVDQDLHVANAAVPTGFYKVFSANISNSLASLGTGYNNYKFVHSVSGNTNYVGFVKDNLNSAPTLVTGNVAMAGNVSGTYTYISGIPYYSATGSPSITVATLELQNFTGQTFTSATPFTLAAGSAIEGTGSIIAVQTKTLAQIDGPSTMLTGSNVKANIGISSNYTMGNLNVLINGAVNAVANVTANIFNVIGTSATVQLPTKVQVNASANTGISEGNIAVSATLGSVYTDNGLRITGFGSAANTPAFNGATNNYTANIWSGPQTIAGTQESVDRYGVIKHYVTDLSTGYLPVGPDLATGRSGLQYFTFAFRRATMANFDIRLTTTTGIAGMWIAAPGTTIDTNISGTGPS
jgi:PKD repeat protein